MQKPGRFVPTITFFVESRSRGEKGATSHGGVGIPTHPPAGRVPRFWNSLELVRSLGSTSATGAGHPSPPPLPSAAPVPEIVRMVTNRPGCVGDHSANVTAARLWGCHVYEGQRVGYAA